MMITRMTSSQEKGMARGSLEGHGGNYHDSPG
jgi:hypothetical protein